MNWKNVRPLARTLALSALCLSALMIESAQAASGPYMAGWWTNIEHPERLAGYASNGSKLIMGNYAGWYYTTGQYPVVQKFLDEAQKYGMKVILGMPRERAVPYGISGTDFVNFVDHFKSHPALYGWYIADEPELHVSEGSYDLLATNPGYYGLVKSTDPAHPVFAAHSGAGSMQFVNLEDITGVDYYPKKAASGEFGDAQTTQCYDAWKNGLQFVANNGKQGLIAIMQGFGKDSPEPVYGDMTPAEMRYQVYSAVVQGVDKILFWMDDYANSYSVSLVNQMTAQIQNIAPEMLAGRTNDPAVVVNQPATSLVYRYGVNGSSGVLLAVNIGNRVANGGTALQRVQFSLPAGVRPSEVQVLNENRTIPVVNGSFTDDFSRFAVHVYRWSATAPVPPPTGDTVAPSVPSGLTATAASTSQIRLSWTSSTDNVGVAGYRIYRGGSSIGTSTGASYSDSGLAANTSYSYTVEAYDAAGNVSSRCAAVSGRTASTTPPADTTAPAISAVAAAVSRTSVTITWTTNEPANSQVEFGLTTSYGQVSALDSALVTAHTVRLSSLQSRRVYHYRIRTRDKAGNLTVSGDRTFTTGWRWR